MSTAGWIMLILAPVLTSAVTLMVWFEWPGYSRSVDHPRHRGNSSYAISALAAVIALLCTVYGCMGAPMWVGLACAAWLMGVSLWRDRQIRRHLRRHNREF